MNKLETDYSCDLKLWIINVVIFPFMLEENSLKMVECHFNNTCI